MPSGRPTLLTAELIREAQAYLDGGWEEAGHVIPSNQGLAVILGVGESTIYEWSHKQETGFPDILDKIKAKQHFVLINRGLKREISEGITKLVLGKHGYKETTSSEMTGPNGGPIETKWTVEIVGAKP